MKYFVLLDSSSDTDDGATYHDTQSWLMSVIEDLLLEPKRLVSLDALTLSFCVTLRYHMPKADTGCAFYLNETSKLARKREYNSD